MAKEVAITFSAPQLAEYGNIILNGYSETVANTDNVKAWQYRETNTPPVDLPSVQQVTPALKGWSTNYMEYYTQLMPNAYGVNPGDPTMFHYSVNSFAAGQPKWNQVPPRYFQNQVAPFVPPNNNSQAIPYSFIAPVQNNPVAPPIDAL